MLIVIEGGEGTGKTTQWRRLEAALSAAGHRVVAVREPGGTPLGDQVRQLLLDPVFSPGAITELLLFAASRAELLATVVRPALAERAVVLVDRFLLSTYAYQGAGRGLPIATLQAVNAVATAGTVPDLTIVLTLPVDDAMARVAARGAADRMEREGREFFLRVHGAFANSLEQSWQTAHPEIGPVVGVEGDGDPAEVTMRCLGAIADRWPTLFGNVRQPTPATSATRA